MQACQRRALEKLGIAAVLIANLFAFDKAFAMVESTCSAVILSESVAASNIENTIRSLSALRLKLDVAKADGSNSIAVTALENGYQKKEQALIRYLEQTEVMTREGLRDRMRQEILHFQSEQERENQRRQTEQAEYIIPNRIDGTLAIFHRIEPGSFIMRRGEHEAEVELTQPFEMMATTTTQIIWKKIARLANRKLKSRIEPDPSYFKGDTRPVEQLSVRRIRTWLTALNKLSAAGEPGLVDVIPDHKQGDVYRLPTEAEWSFVVQGRGQFNGKYHFGNDEFELNDYAWTETNSGEETHPVAQKLPLVIDGNEFYDMHGNVWEFVNDWYEERIRGGKNPQGPEKSPFVVLRGHSGVSSYYPHHASEGYRRGGFRFVRTVPEPQP